MALDDPLTMPTLYGLQNGRASCINPSEFTIWWVRLGKLQRLCTEKWAAWKLRLSAFDDRRDYRGQRQAPTFPTRRARRTTHPFSIDRGGFGLKERADFGVPGPRSHQITGESLQIKPIGPISKAVGAPLDVVAHRQRDVGVWKSRLSV